MNINSLITEVVEQPADIAGIMPQTNDLSIASGLGDGCISNANMATFSAIEQVAGTIKYDNLDIGKSSIDALDVKSFTQQGVAMMDIVHMTNATACDLHVTQKLELGYMGDIWFTDHTGYRQSLLQTIEDSKSQISMLETRLIGIENNLMATIYQNNV